MDSGEEAELLAISLPLVQEVPAGDHRPPVPSPVAPEPAQSPLYQKDPILYMSRPQHQVPEENCI